LGSSGPSRGAVQTILDEGCVKTSRTKSTIKEKWTARGKGGVKGRRGHSTGKSGAEEKEPAIRGKKRWKA